MAIRTLELLETLLAGEEMTSEMLDGLLKEQITEDLYLEYKHGDELKESKKANATIRQYVSGFANSVGGVLIVGVDEKSWTVTGCSAPGGGSLTEWANRSLTNIAPYLTPPPRFYTVNHPKGNVLVIGTARTSSLVPIIEAGELMHYFRIGDQTLKAPTYLISDMVLGRRQRPDLYISDSGLSGPSVNGGASEQDLEFGVFFRVENRSFYWAEEVHLGIIARIKPLQYPNLSRASISTHFLSYVDTPEIDLSLYSEPNELVHYVVPKPERDAITPFGIGQFMPGYFSIPLRYKFDQFLGDYTWKATLYILARNSDLVWYQVTLKVNQELVNSIISSQGATSDQFLSIERVTNGRPKVAWEKLSSAS